MLYDCQVYLGNLFAFPAGQAGIIDANTIITNFLVVISCHWLLCVGGEWQVRFYAKNVI
jgi:hypothetical protein